MKVFLLFIGIVSLCFGVKFIYDARLIVKKYFTMQGINEAIKMLKISGFLLIVFGGVLIYFNF